MSRRFIWAHYLRRTPSSPPSYLVLALDPIGGATTVPRPPLHPSPTHHDQVIAQSDHLGSANDRPTLAAVTVAARAAVTVTGAVGLVAEQVQVDEVETEAAPTYATLATRATIATTAGPAGLEQRQHGPSGQQLNVLAVDL